jgi:uncharacterized protein
VKRTVYVALGTLSLAIGIVGAFLPVLPTTPFILLALFFYIRSSPRMHAWVMNSRFAGSHVRNVLDGHGIPLSVKVFAVGMSFCMIGYVSIVHTESFLVRMLLGLLFAVQVYFMVRIKTLRKVDERTMSESHSHSVAAVQNPESLVENH